MIKLQASEHEAWYNRGKIIGIPSSTSYEGKEGITLWCIVGSQKGELAQET